MTDQGLYGSEWWSIRQQHVEKDDHQCQINGEWCDDLVEVHHIEKARVVNDPSERHSEENLVTLCGICHRWMENLSPERQREILKADDPSEHAPEDVHRLNSTDRSILGRLRQGRETSGSLADGLEKHPQTIRDRLKWLREWGYVHYFHEPTGLHELIDE